MEVPLAKGLGGLAELAELEPDLARSLGQMLVFEGNVEVDDYLLRFILD